MCSGWSRNLISFVCKAGRTDDFLTGARSWALREAGGNAEYVHMMVVEENSLP